MSSRHTDETCLVLLFDMRWIARNGIVHNCTPIENYPRFSSTWSRELTGVLIDVMEAVRLQFHHDGYLIHGVLLRPGSDSRFSIFHFRAPLENLGRGLEDRVSLCGHSTCGALTRPPSVMCMRALTFSSSLLCPAPGCQFFDIWGIASLEIALSLFDWNSVTLVRIADSSFDALF
jgi:hypothetical protein